MAIINKQKTKKSNADADLCKESVAILSEVHEKINDGAQKLEELHKRVEKLNHECERAEERLRELEERSAKAEHKLALNSDKCALAKKLYIKTLDKAINAEPVDLESFKEFELFEPEVKIEDIHSLDTAQLKKHMNSLHRVLCDASKKFEESKSPKESKSRYRLLVLALQAELQNLLREMKKYSSEDEYNKKLDRLVKRYKAVVAEDGCFETDAINGFIDRISVLFRELCDAQFVYYENKRREKAEKKAAKKAVKKQKKAEKNLKKAEKKLMEAAAEVSDKG